MAFFGRFSGAAAAGDGAGIFRGEGGPLTTIVRGGQAAPGTVGTFGPSFSWPGMNRDGVVAFSALITGAPGVPYGMYRGNGTVLVPVPLAGQAAPGGGSYSGLAGSKSHQPDRGTAGREVTRRAAIGQPSVSSQFVDCRCAPVRDLPSPWNPPPVQPVVRPPSAVTTAA